MIQVNIDVAQKFVSALPLFYGLCLGPVENLKVFGIVTVKLQRMLVRANFIGPCRVT